MKSWLKNLARNLRKSQTKEENILWFHLRNKRLKGYKFRRQFPIGKYVVDFCCLEKKLVIELDGGQHNLKETLTKDLIRDQVIKESGFRTLRIWNNEIHDNLEGTIQRILEELQFPHP